MISGIKVFEGLSVNDNPLVIPANKTPDCSNVRIDNPIGALVNVPGFEKYCNLDYGGAIVAIHQLDGDIFSLSGSKLYEGISPGIAIHNCIELQAMKDNLAGKYYLANDIDCTDCTQDPAGALYNGGAGFEPVGGEYPYWFTGSFEGDGHTITGLKINRPATNLVGLFGKTGEAEIKNVGMVDVDINGSGRVGGLVGYCNSGILNNCYSTGAVSGDDYFVGGLVGFNNGIMTNCYSTSSVSGANEIGGLVGYKNGILSNCYSTGAVVSSGGGNAGGLAGQATVCTITNCYSTGSVDSGGGDNVGGLVGATVISTYTNCYSTGSVDSGGGYFVGGLVGYACDDEYNDDFWDTETSGQATSEGGTGKTTVQMKQQATFTNWDFAIIWDITEGATYPFLR